MYLGYSIRKRLLCGDASDDRNNQSVHGDYDRNGNLSGDRLSFGLLLTLSLSSKAISS